MEFDACSYYIQNAQKLKIRESSCYGIHFDEDSGVIVSCTDFGHIHLYHHDMCRSAHDSNDGGSSCFTKKTIHTVTPPIFTTQLVNTAHSTVLLCGGRHNAVRAYEWKSLLAAPHNSVMPATVEFAYGGEGAGNVLSIACDTQNNLLYAGNDQGRIQCYDMATGNTAVPPVNALADPASSAKTLQHAHSSHVHTLRILSSGALLSCDAAGLLCAWDTNNPGVCLFQGSVTAGLAQSLGVQSARLWVSRMDVDTDGNFIYMGGGIDHLRSGPQDSKSRNAFHRASSGWLASFLLPSLTPHAPSEDLYRPDPTAEEDITLVKSVPVPVPIQALHLRGTELVTAGAQPLLTYWRSHNLEPASSMETTAQSIFAIASFSAADSNGKDASQLLAVGGTMPVVDLVSVVGHKEAVLTPRC